MGCSIGKTTKVVSVRKQLVHPESQSSTSDASLIGNRKAKQAFSEPASRMDDTLTIVHFNDVYVIEERDKEPVGGAARFRSKVASLQGLNPLVAFSGDALNPSNCKWGGTADQ